MKILHINSVVNSGSTGRIMEEIARLLIEKGNDNYIVYGKENNTKSQSKLIRIAGDINLYTHGVYTFLTDKHGFGSKNVTKKLIKTLEDINPDVVALYNLHGYYINVEILFKYLRENNKPVVWTLFDCWAFTGHCAYYDDIKCDKWKTLCHHCPKTDKYPKSYVDNSEYNYKKKKEVFTSVDNLEIITHSQWLSNQVKDSFLNKFKIHVTPSALNLDLFKPTNSNLIEKFDINGKIVLGCASVWSLRKGYDDFIKLSKILSKDYQIVLIGLSKKQIENLPNNIIGIQRTESINELAAWYTLSSVFVNPTAQDNFPTTNIEALACGTPVITYRTGGSPEAIDHDTGRVVEKNDIEALKDSIEELSGIDEKIISSKCRQRSLSLYDKKKRYLDYISIIENMV